MIQVAIVDDEKIWREEIEKTIKDRFPTSHLTVTVFTSGEELLRDERKFDVVLMDIELQGMDGFSALSEYRRENGQAIFIILTTHVELSREGYKVEAFRYVDKFHMEEMEEAIQSAILRLRRYEEIMIPIRRETTYQISLYQILYFEVYGHDTTMITADGQKFVCVETLTEIAQRLEEKGFVLTNRSYLANMEHIREIKPGQITLDGGIVIPLSRRRLKLVEKMYFDWKIRRSNG